AGLYEKWGPYVEINKGIKEEFKQQLVKELGDEIVFAAEIYNENLAQKEKKGSVFSVIKSALTSAMDLIKKQIGEINNKIKEMANLGGAQVSQITIEYEPPAPETEEKKEEGRAEKKESPESVLSEFSVAEYSVLDINPAEESASEPADDLIEEEAVEKNEHQEPPELVDMEISEPPITETDREFCEKKIGSQPLKNSIVFDEIAWMGTKASAADEWIKLKNISEKGVNLTNWQILDKDQQIKIIFTDGKPVLSKGFYILERTDDNSLPDASADLIYTGSLNDTDEALYLFDAECHLMDEILASPNWPGGDKENRIAMKRSGNLSWQALPGETTVIFNYSAPPPPPSSDISAAILKILISEVKISPIGERFVELYNPNANEIDLTGWYIQRKTKTSDSWSSFITSTDFEAKIIQPGSYFLVASSSEADIFKGLTLTESNFLILKNAEREIIDEINWETVETGKSFGRKWFNDSQGYGDFEIQEPTPRARNESQAADAAIDGNPTLAVVINEIAWMGTKASAADEWIELYNNSSSTIDLDDWTLKAGDGTPSLTLSSSTGAAAITGGGFLLLERTGSNTTDITEDYIFTGGLSNSGENLELRDSSGVLIDLVDFSLGWPAGATTSAYISMERINPLISGTSSGNWANNNLLTRNGKDAEGNNINGTPRAKNSVSYSRTNIFSLSAFDEFPEINLTKLGSPYIIQADLTVPLGKNLTIEPGVILKFNNQKRMEIDGSLEAAAETADSIIFTSWKDDQFGGDTNEDGTSNSPFYGDWRGLYFKDSFGSKLNNILIKYGQENIGVEGGEISIEDSTISYSEYKGIWLKNASTTIENVELLDTNGHPDSIALLIEGGVSLVKDSSLNESSFGIKITDFATATIKNNSFAKSSWPIYLQGSVSPEIFENQASENAINGIVVDGGDIDSDVVWYGGNLPYVMDEAKSIAESGSLTLEAGTVVKFKNEGYLNVYGRLIAEGEGTTTNPVVFTSIHDDTFGGDTDNAVHVWPPLKAIWRGIKFYNTAALSSLDGARIRYGGGGSWGAITQEADVAIEIKNSMIEESSWAIYSNEADCAKAFEKIKLEKTTFRANNINIYLPAPVDLQCELF
ncbi:MAG: lamin tail domain-containing protein, partial [bacterium]